MATGSMRRFEGKVALVTGASRGIGRAIAVRLAQEGATVVINYAAGADARFPGAPEEALALARAAGAQAELYEEAWDRVHSVNLKSVFFATQEAVRVMMANKTRGRIVCMSSISAEIGTPTQIHYAPTKAGINLLVKSIAAVTGPHGITINAVAPGDIATDISREWDEANPEEIERYIQRCPVRRRGRPEDIAAVAAFLASDEAEFVNGSSYLVDGGILAVL